MSKITVVICDDQSLILSSLKLILQTDPQIQVIGTAENGQAGMDLVRDGGRVVVCGQYTDLGSTSIHPHAQLNRKHIEVHGCWGSDFSHLYRAVNVAAKHSQRVPWREMIGARFGLGQANEALQVVENREVTKAVVVPGP